MKQTLNPSNQADYQAGLMDGTRFYADGHQELMERYDRGSASYQMGFEASKEMPRALDPDFAS